MREHSLAIVLGLLSEQLCAVDTARVGGHVLACAGRRSDVHVCERGVCVAVCALVELNGLGLCFVMGEWPLLISHFLPHGVFQSLRPDSWHK